MDQLFNADLWEDGLKHGVATGLFFMGVMAVVAKYYGEAIDLTSPKAVRLTLMVAVAGIGGVLLLRLIGQQGVCY